MADSLPDLLRQLRTLATKFSNQAASSMEARSRRDYLAGHSDGLMEADESPNTLFAARKR